MRLELKKYLEEIRGYKISNFPVKIYDLGFDIGFENHYGEQGFIRVIPESMFSVDVNPASIDIRRKLEEMNRLVEKSEYKFHFCIALEDNSTNREIVKFNREIVQDNMEIYFVSSENVIEFTSFLVEDCDCEDGFID